MAEDRDDAGLGNGGTTTTERLEHENPRPRRYEPTLNLLSGLARDISTLVRQEARLVRVELSEKVETVRAGVLALAFGALVTFAGGLFLILAAMLALDEIFDRRWLSALIVGGLVTLVGWILLARGRRSLAPDSLLPERAKRSLQKDVELAREEVAKNP